MPPYSFDDHPGDRSRLAEWRDLWIDRAMSTAPMDDAERAICRDAVARMYAAAGLPPPKNLVFVPSPFVLTFAGGFASAMWYRATDAATDAATSAATRAATDAATDDATWDATDDATRAATDAATWDATRAATRAATDDANEWYRYVGSGMAAATARRIGVDAFGLQCAAGAWRMWQGGNHWSGNAAYLSFFRHVARLPIDWAPWGAWETLAIHSGPRIVHRDFCMISDRPERLLVDAENRPHCDDGPFCRWRDGSALYAVHGVRVPWWIVEHPERLTVARIDKEANAEVRRVMIDRYGVARFLADAGAIVVDAGPFGRLLRRDIDGDEPIVVVDVENATPEPDGTRKRYLLRVPPDTRTAREGVAWTFGLSADEYAPDVET